MSYQEGIHSTFTHNGTEYYVDALLRLVEGRDVSTVSLSKIDWILDLAEVSEERVSQADLSVPIIVLTTKRWGLVVLDGTHRVAKAKREGVRELPALFLTEEDMKQLKPVFRRR